MTHPAPRTRAVRHGAALVALTATALTGFPSAALAAGSTASGSLDCTGSGTVTPVVSYQPGRGFDLAVKKAGPPSSSPTWSVAARGGTSETNTQEARVSPYAEAHWGASSSGPAMTAQASCSRRTPTSARPVATVRLGDLTCSGKQVQIGGDGYSDVWISWRKTATGPVHRVRFAGPGRSDSALKLNDVFTRDTQVFDIVVRAYRAGSPSTGTPDEPLAGVGKRCA